MFVCCDFQIFPLSFVKNFEFCCCDSIVNFVVRRKTRGKELDEVDVVILQVPWYTHSAEKEGLILFCK